jgi:hypothetical protein
MRPSTAKRKTFKCPVKTCQHLVEFESAGSTQVMCPECWARVPGPLQEAVAIEWASGMGSGVGTASQEFHEAILRAVESVILD